MKCIVWGMQSVIMLYLGMVTDQIDLLSVVIDLQ